MHEKTLYFHLENFEFYVVYDRNTQHFCGFFSKELKSVGNFNLACIVVLPPYQKSGLGKLLIDLSMIYQL